MRLEGELRQLSVSGTPSLPPGSPGVPASPGVPSSPNLVGSPGFPMLRRCNSITKVESEKRENRSRPSFQRLSSITVQVMKLMRQECDPRQPIVPTTMPGSPGLPSSPGVSSVPVSSASPVLQRYDNITKSESDKREYRALVLSNGMKVMLVSDRSAETSAAALQVNVGNFSNPDELPGLAHFCEHMLFMGTEKYPVENEYAKFLSEHGGSCNACTGADYTMFHFNVLPDHLRACLDIFAQFFIAPLFTESATERELSAVDSEFQNNVCSDGMRLHFVDKCGAEEGHAYRKFECGNRQTLETVPKEKGIDVRQELLNFHRRWYSANIMTLAVVGKESLDDLEAIVVPLFLPVKDRGVEALSWSDPFPPSTGRRRTYCEPISDFRSLTMDFPIPDWDIYYPGDPCAYLTHLVGHEGAGSLLSALKAKGWCNSLMAGETYPARGFGNFTVCVDLTEDGMGHIDDIVTMTFQYLAMLRGRTPQRDVWEERRALTELSFRFEDPCEPLSLACGLVGRLQDPKCPMEDLLVSWRTLEWRPELIEEALALLIPENVRIQIVAKCFADKCTQVEPWYGTKYLTEDIEPDKIKEWETVTSSPEFYIPPPNEFVPSKLDLEDRTDSTCEGVAPAIIRDTPFMRLWFKQDNEFLLPKACIEFEFSSPLPEQSSRNYQLTVLWTMLVDDSLQEVSYEAGLAGLGWSIDYCLKSIYISISGYDDKQPLLLAMLTDRIVTSKTDPDRFAVMKEIIIRSLKNREMDQPHQHVDNQFDSCLLEHVQWTTQQLLNSVESLTPEMLEDFVPRFLRSTYVEGIVFGNVTRERAFKLADIVESRIPADAVPLMAQELLNCRALEIEKGSYYLRKLENAVHTASCASVYLQFGVLDLRDDLVLQLTDYMLAEPCFDTLRTKEQLGYIVASGIRTVVGAQGLAVTVQGDSHPSRLEERIDAFLLGAQDYLEAMSAAEFLRHRGALSALRAERPKQIYAKKEQMWWEIMSQIYNFDRSRVEVNILNTITKEELVQFYKEHVYDSSLRRKLSVHVVSTAKGGAGDKTREPDDTGKDTDKQATEIEETKKTDKQATEINNETKETDEQARDTEQTGKQPTVITDLIEFKSRRRVLPRPPPFTAVPQRGA